MIHSRRQWFGRLATDADLGPVNRARSEVLSAQASGCADPFRTLGPWSIGRRDRLPRPPGDRPAACPPVDKAVHDIATLEDVP